MRAKSIVLILIASGCGLVASIGISQVMERNGDKGNGGSVATEQIFVAMTDIDIGEELTAENVKLEPWPQDKIPEGSIRSLDDLDSRYPRTRLYPGEPILLAKLMDSNGDVDSLKIPEGYRAVSIKVTMDTSVSGLVLPGDRVDIIAFLRKNGDIPKTMTRTILRDVRVFAVNSETERSVDPTGNSTAAKTVSVLVKHVQVEPLLLAHELGNLRLSLRRPNDAGEEEYGNGVADVESLLGQRPATADDRDDAVAGGSNNAGFADWLKNQQQAQPLTPVAQAPEVQPEAAFEMQVLTPQGPTVYRWRDENGLPEVVSLGGGGLPADMPFTPAPDDGGEASEPDASGPDEGLEESSEEDVVAGEEE